MAKLWRRFNQYKFDINQKGERTGGFKQEELIEHFFPCSPNGTHEDVQVQIIGHCNTNDQVARKNFWIVHLDTLHPQSSNKKRA